MDLTSSVARLMRSGDKRSRSTEKLREAVERLARSFFVKHLLPAGATNNLPKHYCFKHWPSGEYELTKNDGSGSQVFILTAQNKHLLSLQLFAKDIAGGWLDDVSQWFEADSAEFSEATRAIETFLQPRS